MPITNYLTQINNQTVIQGFNDINGELVKIKVHLDGITFEKSYSRDLSQLIRFNEDTLNKNVVVEFMKKYGVFDSYFIQLGNVYYQVKE